MSPLYGIGCAVVVSAKNIISCISSILLLALCSIGSVQAQQVLELEPGKNSPKALASYYSYYENSLDLSIQEVVTQPGVFQPVATPEINFGFSKSSYWLRINVKNIGDRAATWKLWTGARSRNYFAVYEVYKDDPSLLLELEHSDSFDKRPVKHRLLVAEVTLEAAQEKQIYIKFQSLFTTRLRTQFFSDKSFYEAQKNKHFGMGLFLAVMGTLVFINLIQFFAVLKPVYFYYSIMVAVNAMSVTQHDGYNFRYLWPNNPEFDAIATTALGFLTAIFNVQMFRTAIDLKSLAPLFDRILRALIVIWALAIPCLYLVDLHSFTKYATGTVVPISLCILLAVVVIAVKRKIESAGFYLMGWLLYSAGNAAFMLIHLGFNIAPAEDSILILEAGMVAEAIFLSMALVNQVRILRKKHNATREDYIQLLEDRLSDMETLNKSEEEKITALQKSREKTLQLASTSHDVYQPLFAIRTALESIKGEISDPSVVRELDTAIDYAESILRQTINDSRQELKNSPSDIHLGKLFNELFAQNFRLAQAKDLKLKYVATLSVIPGYQTILMRILDNLIKNAIRYTEQGKVLYGVRRRSEGMEIQVIDTGSGVPEDQINKLLTPFSRGQNHEDSDSGFGLGLSIIKTLCDQQGFRFDISSEMGKGSVFSVLIPMTHSAA